MGGCAGFVVIPQNVKPKTGLKRRLKDPQESGLRKRKKLSKSAVKCSSYSDMSSETSSSSSSQSSPQRITKAPITRQQQHQDELSTDLPQLLKEEGLLGEKFNKVPLDYLLDVLWETDEFRLSIQREIEEVFPIDVNGEMENDGPKSSAEAENRIFAKAKNAADYLGLACSVIAHLKSSKSRPPVAAEPGVDDPDESGGDCQSVFANETISIEGFTTRL